MCLTTKNKTKIQHTMKNTRIAIILFAFLPLFSYAQNKKTYDLPEFNRISFAGAGKVYVTQDEPQRVVAEGSKELLEKYELNVEDGKLIIKPKTKWMDWNWGNDDEIIVNITVAKIEGLAVAGSGDVIAKNRIKTNALYLHVSGSGFLQAEADVKGNLDTKVSGSGDVKISGTANTFESQVSGSGDVHANVVCEGNSSFAISGSGKIILQGKADLFEASISGSGGIKGENFSVTTAKIRIAGSGSVDIQVSEEIDASIAGSGDVRYVGNPKKINARAGGSGTVKKMN
jgi:hypothetical protein